MAKLSIVAGATSVSVPIFLQNSSVSTGAGLTGFAPAGGSILSGLTAYYSFLGSLAGSVAISLTAPAAVNSAWGSGQLVEIDATHMTGVARFDVPNAVLAAAKGRTVVIKFSGGTNVADCTLEIELTGWDNQDSIRGGLTALPNTACTSNASLITSGSGADQLTVSGGIASSDAKKINAVSTASVTTVNANVGTTQPTNFTGTGASAFVQCDVESWVTSTPNVLHSGCVQVDLQRWANNNNAISVNANNYPNVAVHDIGAAASAGAAGYVGFDWSAIHAPTTIVDLSGTTIKNLDNAAPGTLTAAQVATGVWQDTTAGDFIVAGSIGKSLFTSGNAPGAASGLAIVGSNMGTVVSVTGNVGGNVTGSVGSVNTAVTTGGYSAGQDPATLVLGATASSWNTAGTIGNKINAAASAGDPWSTALPGAYGAGSAGNIVGNNLNAAITSRMATYTQPTGFLAATFPSGTIASTTNITAGTITTVSGNVSGSVNSVVTTVSAQLANGVAHGGSTATLELGGSSATAPLYVHNSGGDAVRFQASGASGSGLDVTAAGAAGVILAGGSSGNGVTITGALHGISVTSQTSGDGIHSVSATSGNGIYAQGAGAGSTNSGNGICGFGAGSADGIAGTGGVTGRGGHFTGGATSGAGMRVEGVAATSHGFHALGINGGNGMELDAGSTGVGLNIVGGSTSGVGVSIATTSGDGVSILPTAGHGITITANGTSKHGLNVTGGTAGTSDGAHFVAGTGGVDLRANIAGTLTTVTNLTNLPAIPSNWLTAAGIAAAALNGKGDWALASTALSTAQWPNSLATSLTTLAGHDPGGTLASAANQTTAINDILALGSPMQAGNVTVGGYAVGEDPWSIIKAATPGGTPTTGTVEWLLRCIDADLYTDESTDPTQWHTVYVVRGSGAPGTGVTLMTKKLWDTGGTKVTSNSQVLGQASQ